MAVNQKKERLSEAAAVDATARPTSRKAHYESTVPPLCEAPRQLTRTLENGKTPGPKTWFHNIGHSQTVSGIR